MFCLPPPIHLLLPYSTESSPGHQGEVPSPCLAGNSHHQLDRLHAVCLIRRAVPRPCLSNGHRKYTYLYLLNSENMMCFAFCSWCEPTKREIRSRHHSAAPKKHSHTHIKNELIFCWANKDNVHQYFYDVHMIHIFFSWWGRIRKLANFVKLLKTV